VRRRSGRERRLFGLWHTAGAGCFGQEQEAGPRRACQRAQHKDTKLDKARMQTNVGNALAMLGERESGTTKLEEALAAFGEALKERTRERAPLDWAISTGDLGVTSMQLAQRKRDAAMAQTAVTQIKAARDALTAGRYLSAGHYETQLKIAESIAEQLKGH
jgi:hypothetical protein